MPRNFTAVRNETRLDNLFRLTRSLPSDDLQLQAHWARYLCILSAGYLETSVRAIFSEYAWNSASPNVARYVEKRLKNFRSAYINNIIQLAGMFNEDWAEQLRQDTDGQLAASVNNIISNRHSLAHGNDTGVSLANITAWHQDAMAVIRLIEKLCS